MKFCNSTFRIDEGMTQGVIRCQLEEGHPGEHSASWDWQDGPLLEDAQETNSEVMGMENDAEHRKMDWR